jgi:hypothetical protein
MPRIFCLAYLRCDMVRSAENRYASPCLSYSSYFPHP